MYSTGRAEDACHSGTGVFYQAVPAVAADGKNILKLIPVKVVNGQVCQEPISKPTVQSTPQRTEGFSSTPHQMKTAVIPSSREQTVTKQLLVVNGLPNQEESDPGNLANNPSPQQQTVNLTSRVPPLAASSQNLGRCQLPVTVKSPVLPRGQCIQIPPNAQVRRVPASELPMGIKNQIFQSSAKSTSGSGGSNVIFVSPVTTIFQDAASAQDSALHTPKPPLKLIPKASNWPNGPIRWVIEDESSTKTPSHNRPCSPLLMSQILNTVKKREKTGHQHCEVMNRGASGSSLSKSSQGLGDALVICNGKVYFVAEKRSLSEKMGENKWNKTLETQTCQNMSIPVPDESDEVIDLCDDDAQDDSIPVSHQDDDKVIFVSYIPPKSDTKSVQTSCRSAQMNMSSSDGAKGLELRGGATVSKDEGSVLSGEGPSPDTVASRDENFTHVGGSALATENEKSNVMSQHCASTQELKKKIRVEVEAQIPADLSSNATHSHSQDESSLSPEACEMADHQLRQLFGIRADVKIHLQRIDEASTRHVSSESDPQNHKSDTCGSMKRGTQEGQSADIAPLQHTLFKLNSERLPAMENCPSGQSAVPGMSCDVEKAPVINYVEPIDEDFLPSNEDAADQGHMQNTNMRRIGRTRKRTMCPCCVPGSLGPAVKYIKLDELEKWTCGMEQISKKGTQTKAARKDWMTSGDSSITGRSKQKCPAGDSLSTASMLSEMKRHKHVKRVK